MRFYKRNPSDRTWWVADGKTESAFTFDKRKIYYFPRDYKRLSKKDKATFDRDNRALVYLMFGGDDDVMQALYRDADRDT